MSNPKDNNISFHVVGKEEYERINEWLKRKAAKYNTSKSKIVVAAIKAVMKQEKDEEQ